MSDKGKERYRVLHGGSWFNILSSVRCSSCFRVHHDYGYVLVGVRLSRTLKP